MRAIIKKRTHFEYLIKRRNAEKTDFLRYLEYEINLDVLLKKRKKRKGKYWMKFEGPIRSGFLKTNETNKESSGLVRRANPGVKGEFTSCSIECCCVLGRMCGCGFNTFNSANIPVRHAPSLASLPGTSLLPLPLPPLEINSLSLI